MELARPWNPCDKHPPLLCIELASVQELACTCTHSLLLSTELSLLSAQHPFSNEKH